MSSLEELRAANKVESLVTDERGSDKPTESEKGSAKPDEQSPLFAHPVLHEDALPGIAGEVVRAATANSEADGAAVLATLLSRFSCQVGNRIFAQIGDTRQPPRVFVAIVGASSRGRKGTSAGLVEKIFERLNKIRCSPGPLSSGEGVVYHVRDESEEKKEDGSPRDPGVSDKRLFVLEGELGAALSSMTRDGNTLSAILRSLWDSGSVEPLTKRDRIKTTDAHVCIVGHITRKELQKLLQESDVWNGFANRFLWVAARRQRVIALPAPTDETVVSALSKRIEAALTSPLKHQPAAYTEGFRKMYSALYPKLTEHRDEVYGVITSRSESQVIRLSLIYALLDGTTQIDECHLQAAIAFWQYCDESARFIFQGADADPEINKVVQHLTSGPKTLTDLNKLFDGHLTSDRLQAIIETLQTGGCVTVQPSRSRGKRKGNTPTTISLNKNFPIEAFADLDDE